MLYPSKNMICKNPLYQLLEKLDWKFIPDMSTSVFLLLFSSILILLSFVVCYMVL